jgi:hypothetical protein
MWQTRTDVCASQCRCMRSGFLVGLPSWLHRFGDPLGLHMRTRLQYCHSVYAVLQLSVTTSGVCCWISTLMLSLFRHSEMALPVRVWCVLFGFNISSWRRRLWLIIVDMVLLDGMRNAT